MALQDLCLGTLGELSGGFVGLCVDADIQTAVRDTDDRGGEDGKKRKVVITITLEKVNDSQVSIDVTSIVKLPARQPKETIAVLRVNGGKARLVFQENDPTDPAQKTID